MISTVDRETVRLAVERGGAQIVEVLPEPEYRWAHLPGARNIPLKKLDLTAKDELDPDRQIIVYCNDLACDMSPRAAVTLARLGFALVHDYPAGKMDWLDADLPYAGEATLAGRVVRRDPILARLRDPVREVASRLLADPTGFAVVVTDEGVVQGTIGDGELKVAPEHTTAEEAMRPGPTTVRPSEDTEALVRRMDKANVKEIVVSRADGTLIGVLVAQAVREPMSHEDKP